jgi:hypothetical protein
MPGSAARGSSGSASGGPSISRQSGANPSSAARRDLAEPGSWWRMPKIRMSAIADRQPISRAAR